MLLCSHPAFIRFIPKPGPWMQWLKYFLGALLLLTVIWLLWVLNFQISSKGLFLVMIGLGMTAPAVWIYGRWGGPLSSARNRWIARTAGIILLSSGLGLALAQAGGTRHFFPRTDTAQGGLVWENYSGQKLEELRAQKRLIFVDFTAAWCLTCQVNERVALNHPKVVKAFQDLNVALLKADWTSQSKEIARALARHGRNSIPFYLLYGSRDPENPEVLPEILTSGIVLQALERMRSQNQV